MVFSSPLFLFGFLPLVIALYRIVPITWTNGALLAASLVFYAWGEPVFVLVAIASALFDFAIVDRLARTEGRRPRQWLVAIGVTANLAVLVWFKYANFGYAAIAERARSILALELPAMVQIALPIGVSFIVFEKITYVVDTYRGAGRPARSLADYLLYVFLFPKLLAGPIVKYRDIADQLARRPRIRDDLAQGLFRFAVGLGKKVLIADPMAEIADQVFSSAGQVGFTAAWLGTIAFSLQIFFDFSGYTDMAIGIARMMGFRLMENFDRPYLAIGFGDFWRRWHISLSTWIRDYLYIPLGGDRVSVPRTYLNLWICFLASGLWHGAAWTFVIWGMYHGLFLTLDRLFLRRVLLGLPRVAGIGFTFLAVTVGWVFFRAISFGDAVALLSVMASPGRAGEFLLLVTDDLYVAMAWGLAIAFLPALGPVDRLSRTIVLDRRWSTPLFAAACCLLVLSAGKVITVAFRPFLYFRF